MQMLKHTNLRTDVIFTHSLNSIEIDYSKVRNAFKEFLVGRSPFLITETYDALGRMVRITSDNQALKRKIELGDFECMKDLTDQTIRSKFQSTAGWINALFDSVCGPS